jgi:phosphoribosylamine--glycine ligase
MGTISSDDLVSKKIQEKINLEVFDRVYEGMKKEGTPFTGILFAGLMIKKSEVNVIEFNVRFGDPEAQSLLTRLKGDLALTLLNQSRNRLSPSLSFDKRTAVHVVMCSQNYPNINGEKLSLGHRVNINSSINETKVYFAGVRSKDGYLVNSGGRVLGVTGLGQNIEEARERSYKQIDEISFLNGFYRKDIALEYE